MVKLNFSFLLLLTLIFSLQLFSQNKREFTSDLFRIILSDNLMIVEQNDGKEIYKNPFQNPHCYFLDLDDDSLDEFLVIDQIKSGIVKEYSLNIYNLLDTFYLAGEINSGVIMPYETFSGEIEGLIIVSGNTDFSYLYEVSEIKMLPINCWKFKDGEIFSVNEELYEIFITENETLLSTFDIEGINDYGRSKEMKSLLASIYINSLNAGEKASAENFLKTFYLCEDLEKFKEELNNLFYKEY